MAYTVQNANVFTAAFSGATAGMGVSGRVIVDSDPNRYAGLIAIANAFAQEFDTLWGSATVGFLEIETIFLATEALWQERSPVISSTNLDPNTWENECAAIIALLQESLGFYADNGYTNPPLSSSGESIVPLQFVRYVDPNSTATGTPDGSIAIPFLTVQDAFDSLSTVGFVKGAIYIAPANTIDASGNLTIGPAQLGEGFDLAIIGMCGNQRSTETSGASQGYGVVCGIGIVSVAPSGLNINIQFENLIVTSVSATGSEPPASDGALGFDGCLVTGAIDTLNMRILASNTSLLGDITAESIEAYDTTTSVVTPNEWSSSVIFVDLATDYALRTNNAIASPRTLMPLAVLSVVAGNGIEVDNTDPQNPIVSLPTPNTVQGVDAVGGTSTPTYNFGQSYTPGSRGVVVTGMVSFTPGTPGDQIDVWLENDDNPGVHLNNLTLSSAEIGIQTVTIQVVDSPTPSVVTAYRIFASNTTAGSITVFSGSVLIQGL